MAIAFGYDPAFLEALGSTYGRFNLLNSLILRAAAKAEADSMADTLDGLEAGVFLIDEHMRVVYANVAGARMLGGGAAVRKVGDSLAASESAATNALRDTCAKIANGSPLGEQGGTLLQRSGGRCSCAPPAWNALPRSTPWRSSMG